MSKNHKIIIGVMYVVVAAAFFFAGMFFQQHRSAASSPRGYSFTNGQQPGGTAVGGRTRGTGFFGGGAAGKILSVDNGTFTIQSSNGSTSIVSYSTSTPVTEQQTVDTSGLKVGTDVIVQGASSNGTISAKSINIVQNLPTIGNNGQQAAPQ